MVAYYNHQWHVSWRAWIWGRSEEPTANLIVLTTNRQVTNSERGLRKRPRERNRLLALREPTRSWQHFVRTNDRTTSRIHIPTLKLSMKANSESIVHKKMGSEANTPSSANCWRKRRKEIGMTLFWDRPIVCSHLASDSLWYDEVD
jgi:hypothetical protein